MPSIFRKIAKVIAYMAAAVVILLAIAVGLFRLMLPRIPEYQDEIKAWADAAIGMQVEFAGMNARWRLIVRSEFVTVPDFSPHPAAGSTTSAHRSDKLPIPLPAAPLTTSMTIVHDTAHVDAADDGTNHISQATSTSCSAAADSA